MTEVLNRFLWDERQLKFVEGFIEDEFEYLMEKEFELEIVEFKKYLDGMPYKNEILIEIYEFAIETNRIYVELSFENYIELVYDGDIFKANEHIIEHLLNAWSEYYSGLRLDDGDEEWFKEWYDNDNDRDYMRETMMVYIDCHTIEQILDLVGYELPMLK
jgi:hypothetical protein